MRKIGLHLRLTQTLDLLAQKASTLHLPFFQCFFIHQVTQQFISLSSSETNHFVTTWRDKFEHLFVHGSYWINLASIASRNKVIERELELAKKLQFTHIVVHPGSVKKMGDKHEGIKTIAKHINLLMKKEYDVKIVLENAAHAGFSIGGDLHDFLILREQLIHPEKILFCIDTAHAYVYGYDINTNNGQAEFLQLVDKTMGLANIALIHLNDTQQSCGSRIDKHEKVGSGILAHSLPTFINHEKLKHIPLIMELPILQDDEEISILDTVRRW